jgi:hypothetical protein
LFRIWERWSIPILAGIAVAIAVAFLSLLLPDDDWRWLFVLHFGRKHDHVRLIVPGPVSIGLGMLARRLLRRYFQAGYVGRRQKTKSVAGEEPHGQADSH